MLKSYKATVSIVYVAYKGWISKDKGLACRYDAATLWIRGKGTFKVPDFGCPEFLDVLLRIGTKYQFKLLLKDDFICSLLSWYSFFVWILISSPNFFWSDELQNMTIYGVTKYRVFTVFEFGKNNFLKSCGVFSTFDYFVWYENAFFYFQIFLLWIIELFP